MVKTILYIATSRDGFIAGKNDELDWLPMPTPEAPEDCGYKDFYNTVDVIVSGSRTYEIVLKYGPWPYQDKLSYIFVPELIDSGNPMIKFVKQPIGDFMRELAIARPNCTVWLLGGAALAKSFQDAGYIDECIITVIPVDLKTGIFLDLDYSQFNLTNTKKFSGFACGEIVQNYYERKGH